MIDDLSRNEHLKEASRYLRGTIAKGLRDQITGAIVEDDQQLGLSEQRRAQRPQEQEDRSKQGKLRWDHASGDRAEHLLRVVPVCLAVAILSFATEEGAREAVASEGAKAVIDDIPNFTNCKPVLQFNTAVP